MRDSDPRQMPGVVQRAYQRSYRRPNDLLGLLKTHLYSDDDRSEIISRLCQILSDRHGDVWIIGSSGKNTRVTSESKRHKRNVDKAIAILVGVDEYGGVEGVYPVLASLMEPAWHRWWVSFRWDKEYSVYAWGGIVRHVLGGRQMRWMAAQVARSILDIVPRQDRELCLRVIEAAEEYATNFGEREKRNLIGYQEAMADIINDELEAAAAWSANEDVTLQQAEVRSAGAEALAAIRSLCELPAYAFWREASFQDERFSSSDDSGAAGTLADSVIYAAVSLALAQGMPRRSVPAMPMIADLVRSQITPTLMTSPSHGLRRRR